MAKDSAVSEILHWFFYRYPLQFTEVLSMPPEEFLTHYLWLRGYEIKSIENKNESLSSL